VHTHRPDPLKPAWLEHLRHRQPGQTNFIPDCPPARRGWQSFLGFVWQMWRANRAAHRWPHKFEITATFPIPWW